MHYMIEDLQDDPADEFVTAHEMRVEEGWDTGSVQINCAECGAQDIEYLPHNEGCGR